MILSHGVQKIGLILAFIHRLLQAIASIGELADPGVVAGDDQIALQFPGPAEKTVELQMPVAFDAGIGGQTALIAEDERGHDLLLKILREIEHIKRDAHSKCHASGILHILQ